MGVIIGAHGLKGEVKLLSFAEDPKSISEFKELVTVEDQLFSFDSVRPTPNNFIVKFQEISDRTAAEALKGTYLFVPRDKLPTLAEGEIYYIDLIGKEVVLEDGKNFGVITDVFNTGANDILEVEMEKKKVLLPYTKDVVVEVGEKMVVSSFALQFEE